MKLIDLHSDTIHAISLASTNTNLYSNNLKVDIEKLKTANSLAQFFSIFVDEGATPNRKLQGEKLIAVYKNQIKTYSDYIKHVNSYDEIFKDDKLSSFLTLEEGGILEGDINNLYYFYNEGIRLITLTWNYPNEIGFPNFNYTYQNKGLTAFGFQLIEEMNRLGILLDVSHLSDRGFYDVSEHTKTPFIASHSNCRNLLNHPRNLTDEMIKTIGNSGGVIGVNFYDKFLSNENSSTINSICNHIFHLINVGGIDIVSIGSDFDGMNSRLEIKNIGEIHKLVHSLERTLTFDEIEKILYKNSLRVISSVLK